MVVRVHKQSKYSFMLQDHLEKCITMVVGDPRTIEDITLRHCALLFARYAGVDKGYTGELSILSCSTVKLS